MLTLSFGLTAEDSRKCESVSIVFYSHRVVPTELETSNLFILAKTRMILSLLLGNVLREDMAEDTRNDSATLIGYPGSSQIIFHLMQHSTHIYENRKTFCRMPPSYKKSHCSLAQRNFFFICTHALAIVLPREVN